MGMAGAILGGAILGMGASSAKPKSYNSAADAHSSMAATKPEVPEPPATDGGQSNALMEAEREKERQQAALRQRRAREVFTGGLGAAGIADTAKKTLLGG